MPTWFFWPFCETPGLLKNILHCFLCWLHRRLTVNVDEGFHTFFPGRESALRESHEHTRTYVSAHIPFQLNTKRFHLNMTIELGRSYQFQATCLQNGGVSALTSPFMFSGSACRTGQQVKHAYIESACAAVSPFSYLWMWHPWQFLNEQTVAREGLIRSRLRQALPAHQM